MEKGIIYNVTTKPDPRVAGDWVRWLRQVHIPDMMSTGCFTHTVFLRLIEVDDTDGPTYAVQYHCESKEKYQRYLERYAPVMRKQSIDQWGDSIVSFRSVLEQVD